MSAPLALVTGASAGLGAAFARKAAAEGYDVAITARRLDRLEDLAGELRGRFGRTALVIQADLADPAAPQALLSAIVAEGRSVDALINNAGYSVARLYLDDPWPTHQAFLQVMAIAPAELARGVLPGMIERRRGRIINVASMAAFSSGAAGHTLYPAAKSFIVKMSQSLAAEAGASGVTVSAACPGFTKTEFAAANGTAAAMSEAPRLFWQTAEAVVDETWRRNTRGDEVIVPGLHNKLAAAVLKHLPESFTRGAIRKAAEKYRVHD